MDHKRCGKCTSQQPIPKGPVRLGGRRESGGWKTVASLLQLSSCQHCIPATLAACGRVRPLSKINTHRSSSFSPDKMGYLRNPMHSLPITCILLSFLQTVQAKLTLTSKLPNYKKKKITKLLNSPPNSQITGLIPHANQLYITCDS